MYGRLYHYAGNNPVHYIDPDGKFLDTFLDIVGILWDVVEIAAEPANPWSWASLAADVGCLFIPGATGGGKVIKLTEGTRKMGKVSRGAKNAGAADAFVDAIKDGERVYGKYKDLKRITAGYDSTIQAHHLVPKAFADLLHQNVSDFASVVIDEATHSGFTNLWNPFVKELKDSGLRNVDVIKDKILQKATEIYKDYPEMLQITKEWLNSI